MANPMEAIAEETRERITKKLQHQGREFAEAIAAESDPDDREMMALALVLDVCDPSDWVEHPVEGAADAEVQVQAKRLRELHDAMAKVVLEAAKTTDPTGINGEAEMVEALREALDLAETEELSALRDSGGVRFSDTYAHVGLMTMNKGLVVRLGNGAEFQIQVVQSKNARSSR